MLNKRVKFKQLFKNSKKLFFSEGIDVINGPGVAEAVLQSASLLIH